MAQRYIMLYSWAEFVAGDDITGKVDQRQIDRLVSEAKCLVAGEADQTSATDYSGQTVAALRILAAERGLDVRGLRKAELIAALEG